MSQVVELAVRQPLSLHVNGEKYLLEFPLAAVIEAEAKLGHSLKTPADWFSAPASELPALIACGLRKHHADEADSIAAMVCSGLDPEAITEMTEALGAVAFPRFLERYKKNLEELQRKGATSPNVQSGDVL